MRISDFKVLTFDTYGTLIDWETGILQAMAGPLSRLANPPSDDEILERFGVAESAQQAATPDKRYSDLLAAVFTTMAADLGLETTADEAARFGGSVGDWPAFPDAAEALAYLREHFTLITLTNCDRTSYRGSAARLGEPWHAIYTAEDVGSYKPSRRNFEFLLDHVQSEFGQPKEAILHVAQSLFHDHVPATEIGLATCWIDRRHGVAGGGATATPQGDYRIDFHFTSMAALADAHRAELAG